MRPGFMNKFLGAILILAFNSSWAQTEPRECSWDEIASEYGYAEILNSNFSKKTIKSINWYTGSEGYKKINSFLRGLSVPGHYRTRALRKHINELDFAINESDFPLDCYLYRGIKLSYRHNKPFAAGEIITDKAFQSTSVERSVAEETFADMTQLPNLSSLIIIYNNFRQKGLPVGYGEAEIILPRKSFFKIMKSIVIGGKNYVLAFRCWDQSCSESIEPTNMPVPFNN
jgi:hypothetical protein